MPISNGSLAKVGITHKESMDLNFKLGTSLCFVQTDRPFNYSSNILLLNGQILLQERLLNFKCHFMSLIHSKSNFAAQLNRVCATEKIFNNSAKFPGKI